MDESYWLEALVGHDLLVLDEGGNLTTMQTKDLRESKIGLYFSAHWCPPCRRLTPRLGQIWKDLKEEKTKFAMIFVSNDKTQDEFLEYFRSMPRGWAAVPLDEQKLPRALMSKHGVIGIPTLVMYDEKGEEITKDAVSKIQRGDPFPWVDSEKVTLNLKDIAPLLFVLTATVVCFVYMWARDWLRAQGYIDW